MTDLLELYQHEKSVLSKETEKRFNRFLNKVRNGAYAVDEKNIEKLREFSEDKAIVDFMVAKLKDYQSRPDIQEVSEHYDFIRLSASWAVLALSREPDAKSYLESIVDFYVKQTHPLYLNFLYWLFGLFPDNEFAVATCDKITAYYKSVQPGLSAYQWAEKINLKLPDISPQCWSIYLKLTTDGESFCPRDLSVEEKEKRFTLRINIYSPRTYNDTFEIEISNETRTVSVRVFEYRKGWFTDHNQLIPLNCTLTGLHDFISEIESRYKISFDRDKIASFMVSKGIDKKVIKKWMEQKFQ